MISYFITLELEPTHAEQIIHYMRTKHVPEVVAQPGFIRCRMWVDTEPAADGWFRYFNHYEVRSREDLEAYFRSDAVKHLRAEADQHLGKHARLTRQVWSLVDDVVSQGE